MLPVDVQPPLLGKLGGGSVAFGLLSLALCWWFPFGTVLGVCGLLLGLAGLVAGDRTNRSVIGCLLAVVGVGTGLLLAWGLWVYRLAL
jgi:hypothetical protein